MLERQFCGWRFKSDSLSDKRAARSRMVRVPGSQAGRVAGDQQVIVDDVERKTAVYVQGRAFVFVQSEHRGKMRHHVPKVYDAIADVDASIEEADEIGVADARFGPGINDGRKICCDVVKEIGSG